MDYDFIEIGTSNFDTCIQQATNQSIGISVEPISDYLNQLPDKPFVKKLNCAISRNNIEETLEVYYVPENVIQEHNLPWYIKGCNAVGEYHKQHHWLKITHLVERKSIQAIPISKLFTDNDVTSCILLKIDTEGSDSDILLHLVEFLKLQNKLVYPRKIIFESNVLTPEKKVNDAVNACLTIGYKIENFKYPQDNSVLVLI